MKLLKQNEKWSTYVTDHGCKIYYRKAGTISGDNDINPREVIYFVQGSAELTLEEKKREIEAPAQVVFPEKTYHSIKALTDISFVLFDEGFNFYDKCWCE